MIAITGANGRIGRAVSHELAAEGRAEQVLLTTRDPGKVSDLEDLGFRVAAADFSEPSSIESALSGVDTLLIISATGPVEARIALHRNAVDAATRAGVRRVVYTSRVNPSAQSPYPFAAIHDFTEARLRQSGMEWTFLRNNEYSENLEMFLKQALSTGELRFGGKGPIAFVSRADVVTAARRALTGAGHAGQIYELSGPEALDRQQLAAVLSDATGTSIRAHDGSREDYGKVLESFGQPDFIVEMGKGLYDASAAGEWAATTPKDVEDLVGRPLTAVSAYIRSAFG